MSHEHYEVAWENFLKAARYKNNKIAVVAIVDSPWIPIFVGINILDYFTNLDLWLDANVQIVEQFPNIVFFPGFWIELGMVTEPSAFGCCTKWYDYKTPVATRRFERIEEAQKMKIPNPKEDGLMPIVLNLYKLVQPRIHEKGYQTHAVVSRGPMTLQL